MPQPDETDLELIRASDADRELAVTQLREAAAAGRLDVDELSERTEAALESRTVGELSTVTRDLPQAVRQGSGAVTRRVPDLRRFAALAALLIGLWALTGAGYFWPVWPVLGVGMAMVSPGGCMAMRGDGRRRRAGPPASASAGRSA